MGKISFSLDKGVEQEKRKYTSRTTKGSGIPKLSKSKHKPDHFDSKLANIVSPPIGKILHNFTYFTEDGIQLGLIYDLSSDAELNSFEVRIMDVNFKILVQESFESIEECKSYLAKIIEVPDNSGLVNVIRDVLVKINQLQEEIFFMFKLLVDPEERKEYEIAEETKRRAYTHKKNNVSKSNNKKLSKQGEDLRNKIRGLSMIEKEDDHLRDDEYIDV